MWAKRCFSLVLWKGKLRIGASICSMWGYFGFLSLWVVYLEKVDSVALERRFRQYFELLTNSMDKSVSKGLTSCINKSLSCWLRNDLFILFLKLLLYL